jgi:hypothetical protein
VISSFCTDTISLTRIRPFYAFGLRFPALIIHAEYKEPQLKWDLRQPTRDCDYRKQIVSERRPYKDHPAQPINHEEHTQDPRHEAGLKDQVAG